MERRLKKSELYAALGTLIFSIITMLILIFCSLSAADVPKQSDGIEINFGDGADGSPAPLSDAQEVAATTTTTTTATAAPPPSETPDMMSQQDPSVAIAEKQKKEQQRQQQQEQIRQQQVQKAAQQKAAQQAAQSARAANMAAGAFGKGGNGKSGNGPGGGGTGNTPGNPLGHGTSRGNSWTLAGRDLKTSIERPNYVGNQEGRIIINITVDRDGNVISAQQASGTNISDRSLLEECKKKARLVKFSASRTGGNAVGRITYNFRQD